MKHQKNNTFRTLLISFLGLGAVLSWILVTAQETPSLLIQVIPCGVIIAILLVIRALSNIVGSKEAVEQSPVKNNKSLNTQKQEQYEYYSE